MSAPTNFSCSNCSVYQNVDHTQFTARTVPHGRICVGLLYGGTMWTKWFDSPIADSAGNATIDTGVITGSPGTYTLVAVSYDGYYCDYTQPSNSITFTILPDPGIQVTINSITWKNPELSYSEFTANVTSTETGWAGLWIDDIDMTVGWSTTPGTWNFHYSDTIPTNVTHKICINKSSCRDLLKVTPPSTALKSITIPTSLTMKIDYSVSIGAVCVDTNDNIMECPTGITVDFSNASIVSLAPSGILTGVAVGTSTMKITKGTIVSNECTVTVTSDSIAVINWKCTDAKTNTCSSGTDSSFTFKTPEACKADSSCKSGGGGGCTKTSDCNDPKKICIMKTCQDKQIIYLIGAAILLMMLK